jgi:OFA family oxalate/formate antiporter-like MFS transporter
MKTLKKNRWLIALSAVAIHVSIGSVYAYSAWKMPLENTFGWSATRTTLAFSTAIFFLGLSAAFLGRIVEIRGPKFAGLASAGFFSCGLLGAGLACWLENFPLFVFSFGVIGGIGLGLGYIAPVSTLVKWFPDRRGLATGLAIMGFGFGGLVCTRLIDVFVPPAREVVMPAASAPADWDVVVSPEWPTPDMFRANPAPYQEQGLVAVVLYEKSSVVRGFLLLGGIYFLIMVPGALYITAPPAETGSSSSAAMSNAAREYSASEALRTPAFAGLWLMLFLNVSCGIALIATAKKMGYEMVKLPVELSSLMVMGISLFNGLGRILWASFSDVIGRANTYIAFFIIQLICFPLLAQVVHLPWLFLGITFLILTCYGGGFSCIPAYISDVFGLKAMPTIHGMLLTAWSLAGIAGPMLNSAVYQRTHDYRQSLTIFGGAFAVALLIAVLMKVEIRRLEHRAQREPEPDLVPETV